MAHERVESAAPPSTAMPGDGHVGEGTGEVGAPCGPAVSIVVRGSNDLQRDHDRCVFAAGAHSDVAGRGRPTGRRRPGLASDAPASLAAPEATQTWSAHAAPGERAAAAPRNRRSSSTVDRSRGTRSEYAASAAPRRRPRQRLHASQRPAIVLAAREPRRTHSRSLPGEAVHRRARILPLTPPRVSPGPGAVRAKRNVERDAPRATALAPRRTSLATAKVFARLRSCAIALGLSSGTWREVIRQRDGFGREGEHAGHRRADLRKNTRRCPGDPRERRRRRRRGLGRRCRQGRACARLFRRRRGSVSLSGRVRAPRSRRTGKSKATLARSPTAISTNLSIGGRSGLVTVIFRWPMETRRGSASGEVPIVWSSTRTSAPSTFTSTVT